MNFTQSFEEFGSNFDRMNIFLWAGAAIIAWVLFKDKINVNPVKGWIAETFKFLQTKTKSLPISLPVDTSQESEFFDLVVSWKKTRDLAEKLKCDKAVKVADEMFPYLSPNACNNTKTDVVKSSPENIRGF